MTPRITPSSTPTFSPTLARVALLCTVLFWLAVIALVILGPGVVATVIGVPAICLLYGATLCGCGVLLDRRERPQPLTVHARRRHLHRPSRVPVS